MAASALRNRNSHKMREGFESFLAKCVEASKDKNEVDLQFVMQTLESSNVKLDQKESARLQKICNNNNKINRSDLHENIFFTQTCFRDEFVQFAKSSKAIKSLIEKQTKVSLKEMERSRSQKNIKIDKALAAFKALDTDNSGYLDREEFLNFASNMPAKNRERLMKTLDADGDGRIDLSEFRKLFNK